MKKWLVTPSRVGLAVGDTYRYTGVSSGPRELSTLENGRQEEDWLEEVGQGYNWSSSRWRVVQGARQFTVDNGLLLS